MIAIESDADPTWSYDIIRTRTYDCCFGLTYIFHVPTLVMEISNHHITAVIYMTKILTVHTLIFTSCNTEACLRSQVYCENTDYVLTRRENIPEITNVDDRLLDRLPTYLSKVMKK